VEIEAKFAQIVEPGKSVGPQVHGFLREQIIHGDIAPGVRLSEAEISRNLSVSRQPVREAFIKLKEEGLVEIRPQRGTFVTRISIDAVKNARFVREAIEADVIKLVVVQRSSALIADLHAQITRQRGVTQQDLRQFLVLDRQFHRSLAEAAGKAGAWGVVENMRAHLDRVRYLGTAQKPLQDIVDQHEAIVNAVEQGDGDMAEAAIRMHLRKVLEDLEKLIVNQPGLFGDLFTTNSKRPWP
jgi:GntR family transcriptional regulator, rspAB operon transcriptional repressor